MFEFFYFLFYFILVGEEKRVETSAFRLLPRLFRHHSQTFHHPAVLPHLHAVLGPQSSSTKPVVTSCVPSRTNPMKVAWPPGSLS